MSRSRGDAGVYQLIVLPDTGLQICRGFSLAEVTDPDALWRAATRNKRNGSAVLRLIEEHIACNRALEASAWMACGGGDRAFFRLTRSGADIRLDLVIDTRGARVHERIPVRLPDGLLQRLRRNRKSHLADVYVEDPRQARNEIGSLIVDFGNNASAFVFCRAGGGPLQACLATPDTPFDPRYNERSAGERTILSSNLFVLRAGRDGEAPWLVLGKRSEELIRDHPLISYVYAPKKYVRCWPEHLKTAEPTMKFRGIQGQRDGFYPVLELVEQALDQLLQQVIASLTNPHGTADAPERYPQIARIMLTYPLTWRISDRQLFQAMVERSAARLLALEERVREQFQVELVCSEPVAVAAYVLWETFFHFGTDNLPLAASSLGNLEGTPELRLLVVDVGGGSTDVACVEVRWTVQPEDDSVDVSFKLLESMRFNRAGDRLSHLIATAIREFLARKYGIHEPLDFQAESSHPAFDRAGKRRAVSVIAELAEDAKAALAAPDGRWELAPEAERQLLETFETWGDIDGLRQGLRLALDLRVLQTWVESDRQCLETHGEPGFMDIFLYLEELQASLRQDHREPHLVVLSGRSTRLPFIRELLARGLRLPLHRIRTLDRLLPVSMRRPGFENIDKLAVVYGAQRFRFGDHIRFVSLPDAPIFNRYVGTVRETPSGLKLNQVFIRPGDSRPRTIAVGVPPARTVRVGNAFRRDGTAQVIAELSNNSPDRRVEVELEIGDDHSVRLSAPVENVFLAEWVPGGNDLIVDNFSDTGRIDQEPPGFLRRIVMRNQDRWLVD